MDQQVRLQKYIAVAGVCSRRAAEKLIEECRVTVNGKPTHLGQKVTGNEKICVDGESIKLRRETVYLMLYKPRGYVTTSSDEMGRKCVIDLLGSVSQRVYPIGRLDKDSEGLLLLTNDGELANRLMHPRHHIGKTYRTIVSGNVTRDQIVSLTNGVVLDDGYKTRTADVEVLRAKEDRTVLSITIYEGKNRQIRRMCEAVGLQVLRLKRERIGTLSIGTLRAGQYRKLSDKEIDYLKTL